MRFLLALVLTCCTGCVPAPQTNTPEYTVRIWQHLVDENHFAQAKKWSTPATQRWLDLMSELIGEGDTASVTHTVFEQLYCTTLDSVAYCIYKVREEREIIQDTFWLVRRPRGWLIDFREASIDMSDQWIQEIFPSVMPHPSDTTLD